VSALVHATNHRGPARAYCGMWIVDCQRCRNAERLDRFQPAALCSYCEIRIEVVWPAEEMVYGIERLLLMRPLPYTQNWNPGETLVDLAWENGQHGIFSYPDELGVADDPLIIEEGRIRRDRLPVTRLREFKAIGA
jgi:hypothetical protein